MSPAGHDDVRAAAALLAVASCGSRGDHLRADVLGADPGTDRAAAIACILAGLLAEVLSDAGTDPRWYARELIRDSIALEAAEGAEGTS